MNAVDTNIWIYCHDSRDPAKQAVAKKLVLEAQPLALPWQVGCEFVAACRKLESFGFSKNEAWDALNDMCTNAKVVLLPVPDPWPETRSLQDQYSLSFWDALLAAACIRGGVRALYSEDFGGAADIGGLSILNPFKPS